MHCTRAAGLRTTKENSGLVLELNPIGPIHALDGETGVREQLRNMIGDMKTARYDWTPLAREVAQQNPGLHTA